MIFHSDSWNACGARGANADDEDADDDDDEVGAGPADDDAGFPCVEVDDD
jgi:hypothetical protein